MRGVLSFYNSCTGILNTEKCLLGKNLVSSDNCRNKNNKSNINNKYIISRKIRFSRFQKNVTIQLYWLTFKWNVRSNIKPDVSSCKYILNFKD